MILLGLKHNIICGTVKSEITLQPEHNITFNKHKLGLLVTNTLATSLICTCLISPFKDNLCKDDPVLRVHLLSLGDLC